MNDVSQNLLTYGLIFAAVLLFNYLRERLSRWQRQQLPPRGKPQPSNPEVMKPFPRRAAEVLPASNEPQPSIGSSNTPAVLGNAALCARALLAGRRNLRQAVVIITVLGPCRAQQPPDVER